VLDLRGWGAVDVADYHVVLEQAERTEIASVRVMPAEKERPVARSGHYAVNIHVEQHVEPCGPATVANREIDARVNARRSTLKPRGLM